MNNKASTRRLDLLLDIDKLKKFLFGCSAMEIAVNNISSELIYYTNYNRLLA